MGLTVNYSDAANGTLSDGSTLREVERVAFASGSGNDTIDLSAAAYAQVRAGAGGGTVTAGTGNDWLLGDAGSDTLKCGAGTDRPVWRGWRRRAARRRRG
ncbi:MAG: hypothetical protein M0C28_06740 [Candidatus Moduliflexus flocculans]|nr:hypothetical protein [Candidatus Moduliflexus flocculans]